MRSIFICLCLTLAFGLTVSLPRPVAAQGTAAAPTEAQAAFADAYVQASRQQEMQVFWDMVHPRAQACFSKPYRDLVEAENYQTLMDEPIGEGYTLQTIPVDREEVMSYYQGLYGKSVRMPVVPPFAIAIFYERERGVCKPKKKRRIVFVAPDDDGRWREVLPCPKKLKYSADRYRMKQLALKSSYALFAVRVSPEEREALKALILRDNNPDYIAAKLAERRGVSLELAERLVDEICMNTAEKSVSSR